jgi:hypothetical protein
MLEQTANGATRLGRAGFRLTAVRPRAMSTRSTGSGASTPASHSPAQVDPSTNSDKSDHRPTTVHFCSSDQAKLQLPSGKWPACVHRHACMQGGSLAATARSRYRNESAPSLMKLAGDGGIGSPGSSMHGQQLVGALPPDSPSPRKSADEAPLLLGACNGCDSYMCCACGCTLRNLTCSLLCLIVLRLSHRSRCPTGATLKLHWLSSPSSVLVVAKPSPRVQQALHQVVAWLLHRRISVVLEPQVRDSLWFRGMSRARHSPITSSCCCAGKYCKQPETCLTLA